MSNTNPQGLIDMYSLQVNTGLAAPLGNDVFNPPSELPSDYPAKCANLKKYIAEIQKVSASILAEIPNA